MFRVRMFRRVNAASVIDVTLERAPPHSRPIVPEWQVLQDTFSASDHTYVVYNVSTRGANSETFDCAEPRGWSVNLLPDDPVRVKGILSAAKAQSVLFMEMVESIMRQKEELERQRGRGV